MKNIIVIIFFILSFQSLFAQSRPDRKAQADRAKSLWIAYLTQELELSPDESAKFWPVYNEMKEKERELRKSNAQKKPLKDFKEMTSSEIDAFFYAKINMDEKMLSLKKEYYPKLKATIPASKVIKIPNLEREFKKKLIEKIQERRGNR
jgi:hypothetical protein